MVKRLVVKDQMEYFLMLQMAVPEGSGECH